MSVIFIFLSQLSINLSLSNITLWIMLKWVAMLDRRMSLWKPAKSSTYCILSIVIYFVWRINCSLAYYASLWTAAINEIRQCSCVANKVRALWRCGYRAQYECSHRSRDCKHAEVVMMCMCVCVCVSASETLHVISVTVILSIGATCNFTAMRSAVNRILPCSIRCSKVGLIGSINHLIAWRCVWFCDKLYVSM